MNDYRATSYFLCRDWLLHGAGLNVPNSKQKKQMRLLAALTNSSVPDFGAMNFSSANTWLSTRFVQWMEGGPDAAKGQILSNV
jgi:hypothetical protein